MSAAAAPAGTAGVRQDGSAPQPVPLCPGSPRSPRPFLGPRHPRKAHVPCTRSLCATRLYPLPFLCHCDLAHTSVPLSPGFQTVPGAVAWPRAGRAQYPAVDREANGSSPLGGPLGFGGHTGTVSDTPCFLGPRLQPPPAQISKDHHFLELIQSREGTVLNPRVRSSRT